MDLSVKPSVKTPKCELYGFYHRAKGGGAPRFETTGEQAGPFSATCTLTAVPGVFEEHTFCAGGKSKKEAQQEAAKLAVEWLYERKLVEGESLKGQALLPSQRNMRSPKAELHEFYQQHPVQTEMPVFTVDVDPDIPGQFRALCTIPAVPGKFEEHMNFSAVGKRKRTAEQASARCAIEFLYNKGLVQGSSLQLPHAAADARPCGPSALPPMLLHNAVYVPGLGFLIPERGGTMGLGAHPLPTVPHPGAGVQVDMGRMLDPSLYQAAGASGSATIPIQTALMQHLQPHLRPEG